MFPFTRYILTLPRMLNPHELDRRSPEADSWEIVVGVDDRHELGVLSTEQ